MKEGFLGWLISLFLKTFADRTLAWLSGYVERQESKEAAARIAVDKAEEETLEEIRETQDEQAKVDAADRGGAADVAARMREQLELPGGPGSKGDPGTGAGGIDT